MQQHAFRAIFNRNKLYTEASSLSRRPLSPLRNARCLDPIFRREATSAGVKQRVKAAWGQQHDAFGVIRRGGSRDEHLRLRRPSSSTWPLRESTLATYGLRALFVLFYTHLGQTGQLCLFAILLIKSEFSDLNFSRTFLLRFVRLYAKRRLH